jgi:hypothetical protein
MDFPDQAAPAQHQFDRVELGRGGRGSGHQVGDPVTALE